MPLVFSKAKMIERLTKNGMGSEITDEILAIMDNLDGCRADSNCWERVVNDEPVYWVVGKDGHGEYVSEFDCTYAKEEM